MQSLKRLTRLDLQGNQLQALPAELLTLLLLNTLNISRNCVGPQLSFPAAVSCPALRYLNLSFNKISSFPSELGGAGPQLEELYLEGSVWGVGTVANSPHLFLGSVFFFFCWGF